MGVDVVVIGAGYAGLTAGAILAHNGLSVEVHEMTGHIGGRATFDRKDGFLVDYGIHANRFASEGAAAAALNEIGHVIDFASMGKPKLYRNESMTEFPATPFRLLQSKSLSFSDRLISAADLVKLLRSNENNCLDKAVRDLMWGKENPKVERLFETLCGLCVVSPDIDDTSAGILSSFLKAAVKSKEKAGYPRGGTSQIIGALERKILEAGAIVTNSRVKELLKSSGRIKGINVKDQIIEARAAVLAVTPQRAAELLKEIMPPEQLERYSSIVPTSGISIDLCLRQKVSDIDGLIITQSPFTLGQFTSNIDGETAPEGKQLATWLYPLPFEIMQDRSAVEAEEVKLRAIIDKMFYGIMNHVEWERSLHLNVVDGFLPRPGQTYKDRPEVGNPDLPNLFLAGDAVSAPGTGGDVAFASGVMAAKGVMEYLK